MTLLERLKNAWYGDRNKEEITPKPKIPRKFKLTYPSSIRPRTKHIIESQMSKSLEEFNKRVDECTKWIDKNLRYGMLNPFYIPLMISDFDKKGLLALRVAISKHSYKSHSLGRLLITAVDKKLKKSGHKYVLRTGKH